jgi:hypothetical protein
MMALVRIGKKRQKQQGSRMYNREMTLVSIADNNLKSGGEEGRCCTVGDEDSFGWTTYRHIPRVGGMDGNQHPFLG